MIRFACAISVALGALLLPTLAIAMPARPAETERIAVTGSTSSLAATHVSSAAPISTELIPAASQAYGYSSTSIGAAGHVIDVGG